MHLFSSNIYKNIPTSIEKIPYENADALNLDYRPVHVLLSRFYLDFILIYPCLIKIKSGLNLGKIWIYVSFMSYSTRVELRNFWLGISYRGDPNRKQSILAPKSWQVIFTMIFYQNSNAVCSKVNKVQRHEGHKNGYLTFLRPTK